MILITGANGQTGRAIIRALSSKGEEVRAFVHKAEHIPELKSLGVKEVVTGDMMDQEAMNEAFKGIRAAYHILSSSQATRHYDIVPSWKISTVEN